MQTNIIDVSTHQGQIDWAKVKADAVMIRACFGWDNDKQIDKQFAVNVADAVKHSTPYRLYHYSYATNASLSAVEAAGYFAILYMSASPLMKLYRYAPERIKRYSIWVAHYGVDKPNFAGEYGIWQYGVVGKWGTRGKDYTIPGQVSGVNANCDVNYGYKDYPAIIKAAGLNGLNKQALPPKPAETQTDELARIRAELTANKEYTASLKKQVDAVTAERDIYKSRCLKAAKLLTE